MNQKIACIGIDIQKDFHPFNGSPLGVPGAIEDTERVSKFIDRINPTTIFASQDSHYSLDISHPSWFMDSKGNLVSPFTPIKADDLRNGKYTARIQPKRTLDYVQALEDNGEFTHFIWPEHCLIGSDGHAFHPVFYNSLRNWMNKNSKWVNFIVKGTNPYTEHFGIFRANVPLPEDPSTNIDQEIFKTLSTHDTIYLFGQARTHCDANSLKQLLEIAPELASKVVVLEDAMSNVGNLPDDFYTMVDAIYEDAKEKGVRFARTTDI